MVDASHEKESRAKETISQLKIEISNLSRLVEQGAGLSVGQANCSRSPSRGACKTRIRRSSVTGEYGE